MGAYDPQIANRVAALLDRQLGVVHRDQLRVAGLSDTAIRGRIGSGVLLRVHRGVYAAGHRALRSEARWLAAVLACGDGAALSHRSAAALWGLRASGRERVDVTAPGSRGLRDPLIDLHRARLEPAEVTVHGGIPVTTVARTLGDLAGVVPGPALERALTQAESVGLYDHDALRAVSERFRGRRGARALHAALRTPPAFTRSELEARMLALCDAYELPRPHVNVRVCGHEVDFLWPAARLIVETDGYAFHRSRAAFERDRRRDAELILAGYRVIRITHARLSTDAAGVAATIRALLSPSVDRWVA
jgi:very-short-patch-repair endonuclease